jgi:hypothetical protein
MDSGNNKEEKNQYFYNPQTANYPPYSCPMFYDEAIDNEYYDTCEDDTDISTNSGYRQQGGYGRPPRRRRRRPFLVPFVFPIFLDQFDDDYWE